MRTAGIAAGLAAGAAGLVLGIWAGSGEAQEDEFAAFREMEKKAFAAFEAMDEGVRRTWELREREVAREWEEERAELVRRFGEVEKASKSDPLKTVDTDTRSADQVAQSQVDFAEGKVKVEVVVVADTEEEARQQAEGLARQKVRDTALAVPAAGEQSLGEQARDPQVAEQQQQALNKTYDEKEKVSAKLPDGRVEARVSVEQSLTGKNGLMAMALAAAPEPPEETPAPAPAKSAEEVVREKGPFTGLLLGASGGKPSLVPTVRSQDGSLVYGPAKVKKEKAIHGMAEWLRAEAAVKGSKRLGARPLKIEVAEVKRGGRLIVSDADAALIRAADNGFLADCQVAILLGK